MVVPCPTKKTSTLAWGKGKEVAVFLVGRCREMDDFFLMTGLHSRLLGCDPMRHLSNKLREQEKNRAECRASKYFTTNFQVIDHACSNLFTNENQICERLEGLVAMNPEQSE